MEELKAFLNRYQRVSGQRINILKSAFLCSPAISASKVHLVQLTLGFRREHLPIRYLGVPVFTGRLRRVLFEGILDKVRSKIQGWSCQLLSQGGEIILLRHVLSSMPIYILQVLAPPKSFLLSLERLLIGFLWDNKVGDKRIHWRTWQGLCYLVEEGGLGFRDFAAMIDAFGIKLWVRLRTGDSLWAQFMACKYFPHTHPVLVDGSKRSCTWRRVCAVRDMAEPYIFWTIGEGRVGFWRDRWKLSVYPSFRVANFVQGSTWDVGLPEEWLPRHMVDLVLGLPLHLDGKDTL